MRRRVLLTAGGLVAALLAMGLPVAATTTQPAQPGITRTEAQELGRAGVLTTSDLPTYDVARGTRDASDDEFDEMLYTCLGVKVPRYLARKPGRSFTLGNLSIESSADVLATVRQARADMAAVGSKKGAACYQRLFAEGYAEQGIDVQSLSVKKIPVTVAHAEQAFAFRLTGIFTVEGNQLLLDGLLVAARVGQTEIVVAPARFGGGTPSLRQARMLTNKLAKRVAAVI